MSHAADRNAMLLSMNIRMPNTLLCEASAAAAAPQTCRQSMAVWSLSDISLQHTTYSSVSNKIEKRKTNANKVKQKQEEMKIKA